jgi:lysyl-tRNA synthetase class 2
MTEAIKKSQSCAEINWRPSATLPKLRARAEIIGKIRAFFAAKKVWEVDTPLMYASTVTDPYVIGIPAIFKMLGSAREKILYLQTSPEYAMKRLLAAGSGSIYQISKAFRQGEVGQIHNPEFTMLEWYRVGFDHHALMDEMDELLQCVLATVPAERVSYAQLYQQFFAIDVHNADISVLKNCARKKNIPVSGELSQRDAWLDLLWSHGIEPFVGLERPLFLFDFPESQASLAKIRPGEIPVASRFEVYFKGVELANGFHELQDGKEQSKRFARDLIVRAELNLPPLPIDEKLIAALQHGLPDCAGVALGVDRLIMLALGCDSVADVISFGFEVDDHCS